MIDLEEYPNKSMKVRAFFYYQIQNVNTNVLLTYVELDERALLNQDDNIMAYVKSLTF